MFSALTSVVLNMHVDATLHCAWITAGAQRMGVDRYTSWHVPGGM